MRAIALVGLGKLKQATAADLLVKELADDNPTIVRAAARSLEEILETPAMVRRVIEAAVKEPGGRRAYADALRQMKRQQEIAAELGGMMVSSTPDEQECARDVLTELGGIAALQKLRARSELMTQFKEVLKNADNKIEGLIESMKTEARKGFLFALGMDVSIFAVGIGLLIASAVLALSTDKNLTNWVAVGGAGATGIAAVLYGLFIGKPRHQVTKEVDHLMAIQVVIHGYLRQLYETDQAFVRLILDDAPVDDTQLDHFAARIQTAMDAAVQRRGPLQHEWPGATGRDERRLHRISGPFVFTRRSGARSPVSRTKSASRARWCRAQTVSTSLATSASLHAVARATSGSNPPQIAPNPVNQSERVGWVPGGFTPPGRGGACRPAETRLEHRAVQPIGVLARPDQSAGEVLRWTSPKRRGGGRLQPPPSAPPCVSSLGVCAVWSVAPTMRSHVS